MCMFASTDVNVWRVLLSAELACISSVGRCCTERQNKELMTSRWQTFPVPQSDLSSKEPRSADVTLMSVLLCLYSRRLFCWRHLQSSMLRDRCGNVVNNSVAWLWTTTRMCMREAQGEDFCMHTILPRLIFLLSFVTLLLALCLQSRPSKASTWRQTQRQVWSRTNYGQKELLLWIFFCSYSTFFQPTTKMRLFSTGLCWHHLVGNRLVTPPGGSGTCAAEQTCTSEKTSHAPMVKSLAIRWKAAGYSICSLDSVHLHTLSDQVTVISLQ